MLLSLTSRSQAKLGPIWLFSNTIFSGLFINLSQTNGPNFRSRSQCWKPVMVLRELSPVKMFSLSTLQSFLNASLICVLHLSLACQRYGDFSWKSRGRPAQGPEHNEPPERFNAEVTRLMIFFSVILKGILSYNYSQQHCGGENQLFSFKSKLPQVQGFPKRHHEAKQAEQQADHQGEPRLYRAVHVRFWHSGILWWHGGLINIMLMWLLWFVCRDVLVKTRHLFLEDVQESCLLVLPDMKQSAHTYLLKPVHEVLKVRFFTTG